jgi:hypothetical protein
MQLEIDSGKMALLRRAPTGRAVLHPAQTAGFAGVFKIVWFFVKSFLTIWVGRSYTTAIDGVAADFAADADASSFEP